MLRKGLGPALGLLLLLVPSGLEAQVDIQHNPVKCIVAERYFKLDACFSPISDLARERLFFRAEGGQHWYFVDMKSGRPPLEARPCSTGIGPRPQKSLIGRKISLYIEAVSRSFVESRTPEYAARVVEKESDCKRDEVAAWVPRAEVTVQRLGGGPAVPFGFEGKAGAAAKILIPVLGAGAAGAAIAAAGGSQGGSPPPVAPTPSPTNPPATTMPPPTTTAGCQPMFRVVPDPPTGPNPLTVLFDMCGTIGPNQRYTFDFDGDDIEDARGFCSASNTYRVAPPPGTTPVTRNFTAAIGVGCTPGPLFTRTYLVSVIAAPAIITAVQAAPAERRLAWTSDLSVPGASGQVVVNGSTAVFFGPGRSTAVAVGRRGENRIEALLVEAAGEAGTWRFELGDTASLEPGSLRVIAGEVALLTGDAIVFRLQGKPGERVVFAFRAGR